MRPSHEVLRSLCIVRLTNFFYIDHNAPASTVKAGSVIVNETVPAMPCWWVLTRTKQLSMAPTVGMIWLCACHTAELVVCASVDIVVFFNSPPPPPPPKKKEKKKKRKQCITIVFYLSWDDCNTQEKLETMVMQNLEVNKMHYGLF